MLRFQWRVIWGFKMFKRSSPSLFCNFFFQARPRSEPDPSESNPSHRAFFTAEFSSPTEPCVVADGAKVSPHHQTPRRQVFKASLVLYLKSPSNRDSTAEGHKGLNVRALHCHKSLVNKSSSEFGIQKSRPCWPGSFQLRLSRHKMRRVYWLPLPLINYQVWSHLEFWQLIQFSQVSFQESFQLSIASA